MEGEVDNGTFDHAAGAEEKLDGHINDDDGNLDRKNSDIVSALERDKKDLHAQVEGLSRQINDVDEKKKSLLDEKTQLESQLKDLRDEIESLRKENSELSEKNESLSRLLAENQAYREGAEKDKDELMGKIGLLSNQVEGLGKENEELKGRISQLGDVESEKEVLLSSLTKELDRSKEENGRLTIQLAEALKEIRFLREENSGLQGSLNKLKHEISELTTEAVKLQRTIDEMDEKTARRIQVHKEECLKLENEKEEQRNLIRVLQTQKESIEKELRDAQIAGRRDLVDANSNSEKEVRSLGESVDENEQLKKMVMESEVAREDFQQIIETKDNKIQQLTLQLQALHDSPASGKQKSKTISWSAVIMSSALVVASGGFICHIYAKLH